MDADTRTASCVVERPATEEEAKRLISPEQEKAMSREPLSPSVARREIELTERDVEAILDAAKTTPAIVARLKKSPYVAPEPAGVAS